MPGTFKQDQSPKAKEVPGPRGGLTLAALLDGLAVKLPFKCLCLYPQPPMPQVREASFCSGLLLPILIAGHSAETK